MSGQGSGASGERSRLEEAAAGGEESFESFILANGSGTSEERRRAAECARARGDEGLAREIECVYVGEDVRVLRAARLRDEGVLRGLVGGTWRGVMDLCADELGRDVPVLVKAQVKEGQVLDSEMRLASR